MPSNKHKYMTSAKPMIDEIDQLIRYCGKAEFSKKLILFFKKFALVDHLSIFIFDDKLFPHLITAESVSVNNLAKKVGSVYQDAYFYRHDPNTILIKTEQENYSSPMLLRLKAKQISDPLYRKNIYEHFKLADRVSLIDHLNGHWIVTNLYRDEKSGEFSDDDINSIKQSASLINGILEKNFTLLPPAVWQNSTRPSKDMLEKIISSLNTKLSHREIQVCTHALLGLTSNGIGLELGIQTATVATLRKRAYAKLNISGLNELFSLCLSQVVTLNSGVEG